jgi:WD40 repeat protein
MAAVVQEAPLVERKGRRLSFGAEPTAIVWSGDTAAVALGDGTVQWIGNDGGVVQHAVHAGAILSACRHPDGASVVTGGDDGRVCRATPGGEVQILGNFERKWVEHLVSSAASGLIVAGVGRDAVVWKKGANEPSHRFSLGATIGGMDLDGKGKRLAVSYYNGAALLYASTPDSGRVELPFGGSHLACTLSDDGRYLITAMQETGLHGWQIPEMRDMRMSGYSAKTRSFSWDRRGKWLATGGDSSAIVWPFEGKTGPMGKAPLLRGTRDGTNVTRVAFHPRDEIFAVGYSDGVVALARLADEQLLVLDDQGAAISALAWDGAGTRLCWGGEDGRVGIMDWVTRA